VSPLWLLSARKLEWDVPADTGFLFLTRPGGEDERKVLYLTLITTKWRTHSYDVDFTVSVRRNETKRNETKRNETKRNETKRSEAKRNETKRNETKRNERKHTTRHLIHRLYLVLQSNTTFIMEIQLKDN
jgi:hypothetical protein